MNHALYRSLLVQARRKTRRPEEAEDLLQAVLLAALKAGRSDMTHPQNRRWLMGAMKNHAAFEARSALRRRAREAAVAVAPCVETAPVPDGFVASLPPALRRTALLALSGHTRREIAYLLRLNDATLRQRIAQIRRRWRATGAAALTPRSGLVGPLPFGPIRRALQRQVHRQNAAMGSHDPDGHLFVLRSAHKSDQRGN